MSMKSWAKDNQHILATIRTINSMITVCISALVLLKLFEVIWLEINSGLTFDLDDMTIEDEKVVDLLNWLCEEFGTENVWYRISSSGDGLHVMIGE